MAAVALADLAALSARLAATRSRTAKVGLIADALAAVDPGELPLVVSYLSGELAQRRTGLGWAALRDLPQPAEQATLTVADADAAFAAAAGTSGPGAAGRRREALAALLARATAGEQRLLAGLLSGDVRQGVQAGLVAEAVARAGGVPAADLAAAVMVRGSLPVVAQALLARGPAALGEFALVPGRPVQPMLAQTATDLDDALRRSAPAALEWKLDGVRVQVHRRPGEVRVFTRTLEEITDRVPEVVAAAAGLPVRTAVLDGEALALAADGRPRPFQVTAARVASHRADATAPLSVLFFDVLHLDGTDLLAAPAADRAAALARVAPERLRVPRLVTDDAGAAAGFLAQALARGHEGVVVKALGAPYAAGRRGAGWLKVKPRHTLDLVVLAAEWGSGRRRGWLSNLHLGARDPAGAPVMLGKTFKGLTDEMLRWQTERLLALADGPTDRWVVRVRPELVVEVAFDGVQTSPRYPGGVALRFARVVRHRPDKPAAEADTIAAVRALHRPDAGSVQPAGEQEVVDLPPVDDELAP